jgi:CRP-like cAMP-binding protein
MIVLEQLRSKLTSAAVFRGIPAVDLAPTFAQIRVRNYRDGDPVFSRGDVGDAAFLVLSGLVQAGTLGTNAKRVMVEIFKEGEMVGELAAIDGSPRTADAVAIGRVALAHFPASAFQDLLHRSPPFCTNLLHLAIVRLRRTYSLFEDASLSGLEHRLAKQVLYLMALGAAGERRVRILSRFHQGDLADLLGATPRSIINILNKWRDDGLATFDGRTAQLTILDLERFTALTRR